MRESTYGPSQKAYLPSIFTIRHHFWWPPRVPVLIPHRIRRKLWSRIRSRQSPTAASLTLLQTSLRPSDTLRTLRAHEWSWYDGQYLILFLLWVFALSIITYPGFIVKTVIVTLLLTSITLPATRQFFLPFLPVLTWLVFFYSCGLIPSEWRPPIWVKVLPALENIFYGANLSNILSAHQNTVLDILAWLPYGIIHFGAPFVCSIAMFMFGPPSTVPNFARSFGWMNVVGVTIQLLFPCSPPWYENMYGLAPADYSIPGSPAGLARLDLLFGIDLYTSKFTASPMVFGAFPSLHAGSATIEALFMSHVFPQYWGFFLVYTMWLWWATMYLSHHYAVDLVGGSLLAALVFYINKSKFLPRRQADKTFRWDYDYVEIGKEPSRSLKSTNTKIGRELDDWAIGSVSSYSSGTLSPNDGHYSWDEETLGSGCEDPEFDV